MNVYLAGPISGLTYDECTSWRNVALHRLNCWNLYSPMRGKEYLSNQQPIPANQDNDHHLSTDLAINARDSWDVRRADIVLANLTGAKQVSIGTLMEIADAWNQGKYIVLVMEKGNVHDHPFVRARVSIVFETLDKALDYMEECL